MARVAKVGTSLRLCHPQNCQGLRGLQTLQSLRLDHFQDIKVAETLQKLQPSQTLIIFKIVKVAKRCNRCNVLDINCHFQDIKLGELQRWQLSDLYNGTIFKILRLPGLQSLSFQ